MPWRPSSLRDQSPSPSRPTREPSRPTPPESSPQDAEPTSTTVSSASDGEPMATRSTGSSRTPGAHPGVTTDTSSSLSLLMPRKAPAESFPDHHLSQLPTESIEHKNC